MTVSPVLYSKREHDGNTRRPNGPDAAKLIGVHRVTLYRWIKDGVLPAWRVGLRKLRVSRGDLLKQVQPQGRPVPVSSSARKRRERETDRILRECGVRA